MTVQSFLMIACTVLATAFIYSIDTARAEGRSVNIHVFAPESGDVAGIGSRGFLVDLVAQFDGDLASTGASLELTGPGAHANAPPFPGTFGAGANLDHFPGLVVLLSARGPAATFGPGKNLANLFNIVGVTNRKDYDDTDIWTTWSIGAANVFGTVGELTPTRLLVAVVAGPAPDDVVDADGNGVFDEKDLKLMGFHVISNVRKIKFVVNGN